jgi:uncharacterized protein YgbK (DUF1537 family)
LAQTVFGQEVTSSRVQDFFTGDQERLRFADAETEADLGQCVDEALAAGLHVFCGSAGLADALAGRLAKAWGWTTRPNAATAPTASKRAVLVVAASRHPQTQRQLALLRVAGVPLLTPSPEWALSDDPGDDSALVMALAEGLASGVAILTTLGLPDLPTSGPVLVTRLARAAEAALSAVSRRAVAHAGVPSGGGLLSSEGLGLVLTGGDAAIAVSRALGAQALRLYGEVASGMPWGRLAGGHGAGLPVVTKAGGFGDPDALMTAIDFLRGVDDDCVLEIDGRRYGPILEKG